MDIRDALIAGEKKMSLEEEVERSGAGLRGTVPSRTGEAPGVDGDERIPRLPGPVTSTMCNESSAKSPR